LDWHSPIAAHVAQLSLVSSHAPRFLGGGLPPLHTPQDALQLTFMNPSLLSHSPLLAQ